VADGLGHLADQPSRMLGHFDEVLAGLQQFLGEGAREHGIGTVVVVRQAVEGGLLIARGKHRKHAFRQLHHRREPAAAGNRARARPLERIVATGIEDEDRSAHLPVLQPLDDAVGQHRGVAHQFFLAVARRRHVGRQQVVLPRDLEAVTGIEEERGVARFDRVVEGKQRLAELLPVLVFRDHDGKSELL
jgi:hypothetical protein